MRAMTEFPALGEDSETILSELGYAGEAIEALKREKVI